MTGWTLYNQDALTPNSSVNFVNAAWISTTEEFDNNVAMSTSWYTPAGTSNDWLVSPSITLPAGINKLYWDAQSYDSTYKDSYKVFVSTGGNQVADFTDQVFVQGNGTTGSTGENTTWTKRSVDLSAYSGQTIRIAFQNFSTDMFLLSVDNITVVNNATCAPPDRDIVNTIISTTSASISWTGSSTSYDIALGSPGFTPSTPTATSSTTSYTFTGLTPNTRYQYYVRSSCGSMWIGPYSLFTATTIPYSYGFETTSANGGYYSVGWDGAFSLNNTAGAAFYADGVQMVFSNSSTTAATNRWLFSRPISLSQGEVVTLKFSTRSTSSTVPNSLLAKVGTAPTTTAQSTTLATVSVLGTTFTENTATYTAPTAGVYYFSFNHNNAATTTATSLVLDKIVFTSVLSTNEVLANSFSMTPNPAKNFVTINSTDNNTINAIEVVDINGRTVLNAKPNAIESNIDLSTLSSGVYMVKINSEKGSVTKKLVKE